MKEESKQFINMISEWTKFMAILFLLFGIANFVIYRDFKTEGLLWIVAALVVWKCDKNIKTLQKIEDGEKVNLPVSPPKWLRYSVYSIIIGFMFFIMFYE